MHPDFELLLQTRRNLLTLTEPYDLDSLNQIPVGFNNNLFWHLGHVVVTQHLLLYKNSGLPLAFSTGFIDAYRKGSKPDGKGTAETLEFIQEQMISTVKQAAADYEAGKFGDYQPYPTSYGYELTSIEDALRFNNVHEGLHFGYAQALRRALG